MPEGPGADELNARSARNSRERSRDETIDEFVSVRRQLIGALRDLPDGDRSREFRIGSGRLTLGEYLEGMIAHGQHHFRQIRQALDTE